MLTVISINNLNLDDTSELDKEFQSANQEAEQEASQEDPSEAGSAGTDPAPSQA
jgi:hypothetical protein